MKFPNAFAGVKKLFVSELITIGAAVVALVAAILLNTASGNQGLVSLAGTLGLIAAIAMIVAFVIQLLGLHEGGKDENHIKNAFVFSIVAIVLSFASAIMGALSKAWAMQVTVSIIEVAVNVMTLMVSYLVFIGIANLASQLGNEKMAKFGRTLAIVVLILFAVSIILGVVPAFLGENPPDWAKILIGVFAILEAVVELVAYILTIVYYGKATKMLEQGK